MSLDRRRQRSVRVTLAIALLAVATFVVAASLLVGGAIYLGVAAVVAWGAGVCASRIISNELAESRRDNFRERAEAAQAYNELADKRAEENEQFSATMRQKVEDHTATIERLKASLQLAEKRAEFAEQTADRNKVAVDKAHNEIAELKAQIAELEAARDQGESAESIFDLDSLTGEGDIPTIVDLLQWDSESASASLGSGQRRQA